MESTNLGSIFGDEVKQEAVESTEAQAEVVTEQEADTTGEEVTAPPADQPKVEDKQSQGLVAAAIAERNRRQQAEQQAEQYRQELEALKRPRQAAPNGAPDPAQYTDVMEFAKDFAAYEVSQSRQTWEQQYRQEQMRREIQLRTSSVISEGKSKYQDFDESLESLRPILAHGDFGNALVLRGGPDVAYYLSKDPAEAYRIASLPTSEMVLEIAELRGMLKGKSAAPTPAAPVRQPIPQTLTQVRNASGQFAPSFDGPTPLEELFARK